MPGPSLVPSWRLKRQGQGQTQSWCSYRLDFHFSFPLHQTVGPLELPISSSTPRLFYLKVSPCYISLCLKEWKKTRACQGLNACIQQALCPPPHTRLHSLQLHESFAQIFPLPIYCYIIFQIYTLLSPLRLLQLQYQRRKPAAQASLLPVKNQKSLVCVLIWGTWRPQRKLFMPLQSERGMMISELFLLPKEYENSPVAEEGDIKRT